MSKEINLLHRKQSVAPEFDRLKGIIWQRILPIFSIYVLIFIAVTGFSVILGRQATIIQNETTSVEREIARYGQVEQILDELRVRAFGIDQIVSRQYPFDKLANAFVTNFNKEGITVESFTIDHDGKTQLMVRINSLSAVEQFKKQLDDFATRSSLENALIDTVIFNGEAKEYNVTVSFVAPASIKQVLQ